MDPFEHESAETKQRTEVEEQASLRLAEAFESSTDPTAHRLDNFPKYCRRQALKRFLALYELFKLAIEVKGSVVDCGVNTGFSFMSFLHLSSILEPENLTRRVYGFDTFAGFPSLSAHDQGIAPVAVGQLSAPSLQELLQLVAVADSNRFLGHIDKAHLIPGDASETIPRFVEENRHLVVSLLFLDFDLYEPTVVALRSFLPRMPRGAILAFDELDNPRWPGETAGLVDALGIDELRLQRLVWDPYIAYARIGE